MRLFGAIGSYWHPEDQACSPGGPTAPHHFSTSFAPAETATARLAIGMLHQGSGERSAIPQLRAALEGFLSSGRVAGAAVAAFWLARELARWHWRAS